MGVEMDKIFTDIYHDNYEIKKKLSRVSETSKSSKENKDREQEEPKDSQKGQIVDIKI